MGRQEKRNNTDLLFFRKSEHFQLQCVLRSRPRAAQSTFFGISTTGIAAMFKSDCQEQETNHKVGAQ